MKKKLIIVDVQLHDIGKFINWDMRIFVKMVNEYDKILVLFNGEDLGWESKEEMKEYYREIGIKIENCYFLEKDYGFLREAFENGISDEDIISILKYMRKNNIYYIEDISFEDFKAFGVEADFEIVKNSQIYLPSILEYEWKLREFDDSDICGGAEGECLTEIEILFEMLNIDIHILGEWVY